MNIKHEAWGHEKDTSAVKIEVKLLKVFQMSNIKFLTAFQNHNLKTIKTIMIKFSCF